MKEGGTARVTSLICIKATAVSVRSRCEAAERERRAHARSFKQRDPSTSSTVHQQNPFQQGREQTWLQTEPARCSKSSSDWSTVGTSTSRLKCSASRSMHQPPAWRRNRSGPWSRTATTRARSTWRAIWGDSSQLTKTATWRVTARPRARIVGSWSLHMMMGAGHCSLSLTSATWAAPRTESPASPRPSPSQKNGACTLPCTPRSTSSASPGKDTRTWAASRARSPSTETFPGASIPSSPWSSRTRGTTYRHPTTGSWRTTEACPRTLTRIRGTRWSSGPGRLPSETALGSTWLPLVPVEPWSPARARRLAKTSFLFWSRATLKWSSPLATTGMCPPGKVNDAALLSVICAFLYAWVHQSGLGFCKSSIIIYRSFLIIGIPLVSSSCGCVEMGRSQGRISANAVKRKKSIGFYFEDSDIWSSCKYFLDISFFYWLIWLWIHMRLHFALI